MEPSPVVLSPKERKRARGRPERASQVTGTGRQQGAGEEVAFPGVTEPGVPDRIWVSISDRSRPIEMHGVGQSGSSPSETKQTSPS